MGVRRAITVEREPSLTPELREKIIKLIKAGVPWKFAAGCLLLKRSILEAWFANGQRVESEREAFGSIATTVSAHDRQCRLFYIDATVATEQVVAGLCMVVQKAAKKDWHAAKWLLETREPTMFKAKDGITSDKPGADNDEPIVEFVSPDNGRGPKGDPGVLG